MIAVRTRHLLAAVVVVDAALLAGGVPLQRYSWSLVESHSGDVHSLLLALAANLTLLAVTLVGLLAAGMLAQRGAWFAVKRYAAVYARLHAVRQTKSPR